MQIIHQRQQETETIYGTIFRNWKLEIKRGVLYGRVLCDSPGSQYLYHKMVCPKDCSCLFHEMKNLCDKNYKF